ncbi:MAG: hypothetical protein JSV80_12185 [Acidobacteriota bacterium]|nr:MAG: hypothetical protein JSV80_12185 [Acidobacteriota bacterium]
MFFSLSVAALASSGFGTPLIEFYRQTGSGLALALGELEAVGPQGGEDPPIDDRLHIDIPGTPLRARVYRVDEAARDPNVTCSPDPLTNVCQNNPAADPDFEILWDGAVLTQDLDGDGTAALVLQCDPSLTHDAVLVASGCSTFDVTSGDLIEFENDDEECGCEREDGVLEIEGPSLVLRVTATDAAGNSTTVEAVPTALSFDNDTEWEVDN